MLLMPCKNILYNLNHSVFYMAYNIIITINYDYTTDINCLHWTALIFVGTFLAKRGICYFRRKISNVTQYYISYLNPVSCTWMECYKLRENINVNCMMYMNSCYSIDFLKVHFHGVQSRGKRFSPCDSHSLLTFHVAPC